MKWWYYKRKQGINTVYLMYVFVVCYGLCSCIICSQAFFTSEYPCLLPWRGSRHWHFCIERKTVTSLQWIYQNSFFAEHLAIFRPLFTLRVGLSMNGVFRSYLPPNHTHLPYSRDLPSSHFQTTSQGALLSALCIMVPQGWLLSEVRMLESAAH